MSFDFENLGEFKFIFDIKSGYESRGQVGTFREKPEVENLMQVYLYVLCASREDYGEPNLAYFSFLTHIDSTFGSFHLTLSVRRM